MERNPILWKDMYTMKREKWKWYQKLCLALAIILIGSIGAMLIQTNFGAVSIKNIEIVTDHQQYLGATMYIPKIASAENMN